MKWSKERIFELRKKLGLSRSQFAELLNASEQVVWCWETERRNPSAISRRLLDLVAGEADINKDIEEIKERKQKEFLKKEKILAFREKLGLNQTRFAEKVGRDLSTISYWESGTKSPDPESRRRLKSLAEKEGIDLQKLKEAKK